MIPVMIWSTVIMPKKYRGLDYTWAVLVTLGCSIFILCPRRWVHNHIPRQAIQGLQMEIHNQIFYTTLCSCVLSFTVYWVYKCTGTTVVGIDGPCEQACDRRA